jgi:hypothetical protein
MNPEKDGEMEASLSWFFLLTVLRLTDYESAPKNYSMQQKNRICPYPSLIKQHDMKTRVGVEV